jgi:hypothetical protein
MPQAAKVFLPLSLPSPSHDIDVRRFTTLLLFRTTNTSLFLQCLIKHDNCPVTNILLNQDDEVFERSVAHYIWLGPYVPSFFESRIPLYYICVTNCRDVHTALSCCSPHYSRTYRPITYLF